MTPLWIAAAAWFATLLCVARCRLHQRREELTYEYRLPQARGLAGLGAGIARSFEATTWGSSEAMWRVRCEASLKASKRRRGLSV